MDSYPTRANDIDVMLETMLKKLRDDPHFADSWIIYAGERNTGHVSGRHAIIMNKFRRTYSILERSDRNYGLWLTKDRKQLYKEHMRKVLADNALLFYKDFVFWSEGSNGPHARRNELRGMLEGQLRACVPDGRGGWTGKCDVEGKRIQGQVDDLTNAMCMAIFVALNFMGRRFPFVDYSVFGQTSIMLRADESAWYGPSYRRLTHAVYA